MTRGEAFNKYFWYGFIAILSFVVMAFAPFLGSALGGGFIFPSTLAGWMVWTISKLAVAGLNVIIFHAFMEQAKLNVANHPHYIEALQILEKTKFSAYKLIDPKTFVRNEYIKKGTTLAITSILGAFTLTQAILVFDLIVFLSYFFTIFFGIIFGILQMLKMENFWITDYYIFAKHIEEKKEEKSNVSNINTNNDEIERANRADI